MARMTKSCAESLQSYYLHILNTFNNHKKDYFFDKFLSFGLKIKELRVIISKTLTFVVQNFRNLISKFSKPHFVIGRAL